MNPYDMTEFEKSQEARRNKESEAETERKKIEVRNRHERSMKRMNMLQDSGPFFAVIIAVVMVVLTIGFSIDFFSERSIRDYNERVECVEDVPTSYLSASQAETLLKKCFDIDLEA